MIPPRLRAHLQASRLKAVFNRVGGCSLVDALSRLAKFRSRRWPVSSDNEIVWFRGLLQP